MEYDFSAGETNIEIIARLKKALSDSIAREQKLELKVSALTSQMIEEEDMGTVYCCDCAKENERLKAEVERLQMAFALEEKRVQMAFALEEKRVQELQEEIHQLNIGKGSSITGQEADKLRQRIDALKEAGDEMYEDLEDDRTDFESLTTGQVKWNRAVNEVE